MLKTIESLDKLASSRNNGNKSAFSRNDDSKLVSEKNNGNNEVDRFGISKNDVEYTKKSEKLFKAEKSKSKKTSKSWKLSKSRKSKSKKTSKSWNLAKSEKKLLKSRNSTNFDAMETKQKFLTLDARTAFNRLWLAFTKAPILWHFDLKCYN